MLHRKKWARQYKNQMQSAPEKSNGTLINRKEENTVLSKTFIFERNESESRHPTIKQ